jgi:CubicO group peptidase (beta-lactamase class C family)
MGLNYLRPARVARLVPIVIGIAVAPTLSSAQQQQSADDARVVTAATRARIDSTLRAFVDAGSVAGISALVYEKGREAYFNAYGKADREAGRAMSRDVIVQIFSMTKPVVGVALMTLYDQGRFQMDDPVSKYLPELANVRVYAGKDASGAPITVEPRRPITIRDITRHTSGLANPDYPEVAPLLAAVDAFNPRNTLSELVKRLASVPLWFHPGDRWAYGASVDVQALLVERLSGKPFDRYLEEHVFAPLRMRETRYFVPEADRPRFAAMYRRGDAGVLSRVPDSTGRAFNSNYWPLTPGSWGLTSTLDDYMRFARMLVNGGALDGVRILRPETVRLMATSQLSDSVTQRSWLPSKGQVGTLFWVDPVNQLTAVLFVQLLPYDPIKLHKGFRDAVYGRLQTPTASAH